MYILHTVLGIFPKVQTKRICLKMKSLFGLQLIYFIYVTFMSDLGVTL